MLNKKKNEKKKTEKKIWNHKQSIRKCVIKCHEKNATTKILGFEQKMNDVALTM